ncbi:hypothetical protein AB7W11_12815 [Providencia manganoxydans]|uniref:hypothetical protein n=1 Tax=Providencia manganoxydans TaxID=2923283 RepID=UPI0034E37A4F
MPFFHKVDCSSSLTKGEVLSNKIFSYCYNSKFRTKSETESKAIFLGRLHQVKIACHGKEYYKLIGILNDSLNHEGIKSKTFCDEIRRIIIQEAEPVRLEDEKYYSSNILLGNKKGKATCTGSNPFEGGISLNIKRKDIKQKHLDEIDRIAKNWMSDDRWGSILLEAQVLALSCRSKVVYEKINKILNKFKVETPASSTQNQIVHSSIRVKVAPQSSGTENTCGISLNQSQVATISQENDSNMSCSHNDNNRIALGVRQEECAHNKQVTDLLSDILFVIGDKKKLTKTDKKIITEKIIALKNSDFINAFEYIDKAWLYLKDNNNIKSKKIREQVERCFHNALNTRNEHQYNKKKVKCKIKLDTNSEKKKIREFCDITKETVSKIKVRVQDKSLEVIARDRIRPEDTFEDILNKKKDNKTISEHTQNEITKRIEEIKIGKDNFSIVSELSKKKEYLLKLGMKTLVHEWVLAILEFHIALTKLSSKFNVEKFGIRNILEEVDLKSIQVDNVIADLDKIMSNIDEVKQKAEFVARCKIIYNLLKDNIYYLDTEKIVPFITKRLNFDIEQLKAELDNSKEISKEEQIELKEAKDNLLDILNKVPNNSIGKISHLIDNEKNNKDLPVSELIKKINLISKIISLDNRNINLELFFSEHLKLSVDILIKKEDKLWYKQLSFKEKIQFKGKKIWHSLMSIAKNIKHSITAFFIRNNHYTG